jgi:hypothetical protein
MHPIPQVGANRIALKAGRQNCALVAVTVQLMQEQFKKWAIAN